MKFQYFTYFLNSLEQQTLFPDTRDKNELLRNLLERDEIEYETNGAQLAFVSVRNKDNYFVGRLGRKASIKRSSPPDEKFAERREEDWPNCSIVINTNPEEGLGQKIAFELNTKVFRNPLEQLQRFSQELNSHLFTSGYAISINPITEERKFWEIVQNNEDKIEKLIFTFNSPNLFGIDNSLNEDLDKLHEVYLSTKVSLELENPDGKLLVPENELTKQAVEYITQGGGQFSMKIKGKHQKISSKDNIKSKVVDDIEIDVENATPETLREIFDRIFR